MDGVDARSVVQKVMTVGTISVGEKVTLRSLAVVLADAGIGVALVKTEDGSTGIVSERDLIEALADGADPDEIWSADVMSPSLLTAEVDERIIDVARRMVAEGVRHLPVVDGGEIVGLVSTRDLLPVLTDELATLM